MYKIPINTITIRAAKDRNETNTPFTIKFVEQDLKLENLNTETAMELLEESHDQANQLAEVLVDLLPVVTLIDFFFCLQDKLDVSSDKSPSHSARQN